MLHLPSRRPGKLVAFLGQIFPSNQMGRCVALLGVHSFRMNIEERADGGLRVIYGASIRCCRPCPLREQCQWSGNATAKPRRVSVLLHPLPGGSASLRLRGLAPTTPAACLSASASPAPLGPDGSGSGETLCFIPSDALSGRAGALSLVLAGAAGSSRPNRSGRAHLSHAFRDSRPPGVLPRTGHRLTPFNLQRSTLFLGHVCFSERFLLSAFSGALFHLRSYFSFSLSSFHFSAELTASHPY
jgi:hypothetical protein